MTGSQQYEFRIRGHLGAKMLRAFPALRARIRGGDTVLTGLLPDQAALYGVIARVEALGLELLELRRLPGQRKRNPSGRLGLQDLGGGDAGADQGRDTGHHGYRGQDGEQGGGQPPG
jgi:hypothetical protein